MTRRTITSWATMVMVGWLGTVAMAAPAARRAPAKASEKAAPAAAPDTGRAEPVQEPAKPDPGATPAPDPKRRMVGILDVRIDGVPDETKVQFERGLEEQLDTNQYWLSSRAQLRERMKFSTKWTEGCLVGSCLSEVKTQTSAEIVLLAAFNGSGTSFGYVVTLVRTDNGKVLAQDSGRCDVCTVKEAMGEATLATIKILNAVPDKLPDENGDRGASIDLAVGKLTRTLDARERRWTRRGVALLVTGLAVAAGGTALYLTADKPAYALGLATGGAGLAAGGVFVLTF